MGRFWIAILLYLPSLVLGQDANAWLAVPGKSVGKITAQTTPAELKGMFGAERLKDAMISSGGDAEPETATIVDGDHPEAALTVFWDKLDAKGQHPAAAAHPAAVALCYSAAAAPRTCKWRFANGVGFGTSLRRLELLNGGAFDLAGFGWDYSGSVVGWKGGKLKHVFQDCGPALLRLEPLNPAGGSASRQQKWLMQVSGDGHFSSHLEAMQQLNPVVDSITVTLFSAAACIGG